MNFKHLRSAKAGLALASAALMTTGTPAVAQPVEVDPVMYEQVVAAVNQIATDTFMTNNITAYANQFADQFYEENPEKTRQWTPAESEKYAAVYLAPVAGAVKSRIYRDVAAAFAPDAARQLVTLLADPAARATFNCGMQKTSAERTPAHWAGCGKAPGRAFTPAERDLADRATLAVIPALTQPLVNGGLGGSVCHVIEKLAQSLSSAEATYKFGISFALGEQEAPKRCDVHKLRWSALAGIDAQLMLEPQMVFEKKED